MYGANIYDTQRSFLKTVPLRITRLTFFWPIKIICLSLFAPIIGATSLFSQYRFAFPFQIFQNESHIDSSLASFIVSESAVALQGVLDNIGSEGAKASGAGAGLITASPSRADPNCELSHFLD